MQPLQQDKEQQRLVKESMDRKKTENSSNKSTTPAMTRSSTADNSKKGLLNKLSNIGKKAHNLRDSAEETPDDGAAAHEDPGTPTTEKKAKKSSVFAKKHGDKVKLCECMSCVCVGLMRTAG